MIGKNFLVKIALFFFVVLGSMFFGIIAHEIVHVIQFEGEVAAIGLEFQSPPNIKFFVRSNGLLDIQRPIEELESEGYSVQMVAMILSVFIGSWLISELGKEEEELKCPWFEPRKISSVLILVDGKFIPKEVNTIG